MYSLAKNGVFSSFQGEGILAGTPMVFVRLAGCSIGCSNCDTNYSHHETLTAKEIASRVKEIRGDAEWVAVTGGEPADRPLWELLEAMRLCGRVFLQTSGHRCLAGAGRLCHFIAVSPHSKPEDLEILRGPQINLVPGLGGLSLSDWETFDASGFQYKYVTPLHGNSVAECADFVSRRKGWRLGFQAHKTWRLP